MNSKKIDIESFNYAVSNLSDGIIFERFAQHFITASIGHKFNPVGGSKDKGIDGFQSLFHSSKNERYIYQISTEIAVESKIMRSIVTLQRNNKEFTKLVYVTNRKVNNKDTIEDNISDDTGKRIQIYDLNWFSINVLNFPDCIRAYETYVEPYYHSFNKPGTETILHDFESDPRLFIFLKHQLDERINEGNDLSTLEILADSLILFLLEGTDPEKGKFLTRNELKDCIRNYIKFEPKSLFSTIDDRLIALSQKPLRKINHHKSEDKFCLPYKSRQDIIKRDILDSKLYSDFNDELTELFKEKLADEDIKVNDLQSLLNQVLHKIFYDQGIEFSEFILSEGKEFANEKKLSEIIARVVDNSNVILKNKETVKTSLLVTIREIIYNGTDVQRKFLGKLSSTYMMIFLLSWEPKIASFFNLMASELELYVGNSIIIPALSELFLKKENRRHWNLLQGASKSGASLVINDKIVNELAGHFRKIFYEFNSYYRNYESNYDEVSGSLITIDEILIRAYFYSRRNNNVRSFEEFLNYYVNSNFKSLEEDLVHFLKNTFGFKFKHSHSITIEMNEDDLDVLTSALTPIKGDKARAETDAWQILSIYALREINNELDSGGIFGYKTWWLSKDTKTFSTVKKVLGEKYNTSCYIRPDFLYNYISLSPSKSEVDSTFKELFPSMLGINLSYHLPKEIIKSVKTKIRKHGDIPEGRMSSILRQMTEEIKTNGENLVGDTKKFDKFLDDLLEE